MPCYVANRYKNTIIYDRILISICNITWHTLERTYNVSEYKRGFLVPDGWFCESIYAVAVSDMRITHVCV